MRFMILNLLLLLLSSCQLIKIKGPTDLRGFYSYYNKTKEDYPNLLVKTDSIIDICVLEYSVKPKVYIINALQLKECLNSCNDAIVYIWDPHCPSDQCVAPNLLQAYCDENNAQLFVVAKYYDGEELVQYYDIEKPIFGIDTEYYKSDLIKKYTTLFENDLGAYDNESSRMLLFEKGKYLGRIRI